MTHPGRHLPSGRAGLAQLLSSRNLLLIGLCSMLTDISSEMVYPLLPALVVGTLGASKGMLGLIEGLAEATAQLPRVIFGALSDRSGRRRTLAASGYACSPIGKVLVALAHSSGWVLAGRMVDRLGKAIRSAPRDALLAESVGPELRGRAFGLHRTMDTLGAFVGVAIAYASVRWGADVRAVMGWSILPAALGVAAFLLVREEPRPRPHAAGAPSAARSFFTHPREVWGKLPRKLRGYFLIVFLFTLGNSSNLFLLTRAGEQGLGAQDVVLAYGLYNLVYVLASYPAGAMSDRIGRRRVLVSGYFVHGVTYLGMALAPMIGGASSVWWLMGLYGVHMGLTEGIEKALVVDLAPPELRATALGLLATIFGLALLPASVLAGVLWDHAGPAAPFYLGGATGLVACVLVAIMLRTRAVHPPAIKER